MPAVTANIQASQNTKIPAEGLMPDSNQDREDLVRSPPSTPHYDSSSLARRTQPNIDKVSIEFYI